MHNKNSPIPIWLAPVVGPVVGAGLAVSAAGRDGAEISPQAAAIGGVVAGLAAGVVLLVVDWRRKSNSTVANTPSAAGTTRSSAAPAEPMSGVVRVGMLVFAAIIFISGIVVETIGVQNVLIGRRSQTWPVTQGQMKVVEAHEQPRGRRQKEPSYAILCSYHYTVGGVPYMGTRWRFSGSSVSEAEAHRFVDAHPRGAAVDVYYDPANPVESTLVRGVDKMQYFAVALMGPLMIVGAVATIYWLAFRRAA